MTRNFLDQLMHGYPDDPRMTWEIRAINRQTRDVSQSWFGVGYSQVAADYCQSIEDEYDVYVGVLPRNGRRGFAQDVLWATRLYVDVDTDGTAEGILAAEALLRQAPVPEPHMFVRSGGGVHAYWGLKEPYDMSNRKPYTDLLKRLVRTIGGEKGSIAYADPAATDCSRVLRVPGTYNHKYNPARQVTYYCLESHPITFEEWDRMLRPLPVRVVTQTMAPMTAFGHSTVRQVIDRACASRRGDEFRRLYTGDLSGYGGDESRADMALLGLLRFFCQGNEQLMLAVFGTSALGNRDKWRDREDYRKRTLDRVMGRA